MSLIHTLLFYHRLYFLSCDYTHVGVMSGLDRELLTKIRCVCLVDAFGNVVGIDKQNPSFKEPVLTAYYAAPGEVEGGVAEGDAAAGEGDGDGQPSSSSKKSSKRKRGQVASPQVSFANVTTLCFPSPCHPLLFTHFRLAVL